MKKLSARERFKDSSCFAHFKVLSDNRIEVIVNAFNIFNLDIIVSK